MSLFNAIDPRLASLDKEDARDLVRTIFDAQRASYGAGNRDRILLPVEDEGLAIIARQEGWVEFLLGPTSLFMALLPAGVDVILGKTS